MAPENRQFEQMIEEHGRLIRGALRKACGTRHAELIPDLEQEVHLSIWKVLVAGKTIDHPVSYLYRVATNAATAAMKRQREEPYDPAEQAHVFERNEVEKVAEWSGLNGPERQRLLEELLKTLPEDVERALRAYLAGFNHAEVAKLFGWTVSVARHRIYRGMDTLKERYVGEETE